MFFLPGQNTLLDMGRSSEEEEKKRQFEELLRAIAQMKMQGAMLPPQPQPSPSPLGLPAMNPGMGAGQAPPPVAAPQLPQAPMPSQPMPPAPGLPANQGIPSFQEFMGQMQAGAPPTQANPMMDPKMLLAMMLMQIGQRAQTPARFRGQGGDDLSRLMMQMMAQRQRQQAGEKEDYYRLVGAYPSWIKAMRDKPEAMTTVLGPDAAPGQYPGTVKFKPKDEAKQYKPELMETPKGLAWVTPGGVIPEGAKAVGKYKPELIETKDGLQWVAPGEAIPSGARKAKAVGPYDVNTKAVANALSVLKNNLAFMNLDPNTPEFEEMLQGEIDRQRAFITGEKAAPKTKPSGRMVRLRNPATGEEKIVTEEEARRMGVLP